MQYDDDDNGNDDENNNEEDNNRTAEIAVTSRAMAFAFTWTAILATVMSVFGMVVLGFQSPTGQYYYCCSSNVHRTSSLTIGAFVGALLMFANLTLVCSVLFGEFKIRDYRMEGEDRERDGEWAQEQAVDRTSVSFSIMCMFLTIIYAGYAALVFALSNALLDENRADARNEALSPSAPNRALGYIHGDHRFDVPGANDISNNTTTFVKPQQSDSSLA